MAPALITFFCIAAAALTVALAVAVSSIRVVPEAQRLEIYRMGKYIGRKGPGLVILIPFLDRARVVDAHAPENSSE